MDKETGVVYLGGDKLGSNGYTKTMCKDPKVFKVGPFYFGYTTSFYMGQILKYRWQQPCRTMYHEDDEYIFKDVIDSLKSCFVNNDFGKKQEGREPDFGSLIMVYKGRIFEVQHNMSLLEIENFTAVGCGDQLASGAATALLSNTNYNPEQIIKETMKIVSQFSCGVSEQCDIIKCV
jgi:hypothetical protein